VPRDRDGDDRRVGARHGAAHRRGRPVAEARGPAGMRPAGMRSGGAFALWCSTPDTASVASAPLRPASTPVQGIASVAASSDEFRYEERSSWADVLVRCQQRRRPVLGSWAHTNSAKLDDR
jgi:hypothetical protein